MERINRIPFWWIIVAAFTAGWVLMYADRTILNPVMPHLAEEFGLTNAQLGLVNSVFFIAYAIAQIPSGSLGDRFGRRRILVPGFIIFGLLTGATGLATTFFFFLMLRFDDWAGGRYILRAFLRGRNGQHSGKKPDRWDSNNQQRHGTGNLAWVHAFKLLYT